MRPPPSRQRSLTAPSTITLPEADAAEIGEQLPLRASALAAPRIQERVMPVELLRDCRGPYGIGVAEEFDYEAVAWRCGVED